MMSLKFLGGATIEGPEGTLSGPATHRHRLALLARLAAEHPRGMPRESLTALLWPDAGPTSARNLLNQAVYVLRKTLGEATIRTSGDRLLLDTCVAPCDVVAFESAVRQGDFDAAVELYAGPFLDGFHLPGAADFGLWLDAERESLHRTYADALAALARGAEDAGAATGWWRRLSAADPFSTSTTLSLMAALEATGDHAGALRQAHAHAALLREAYDAAPHPEVVALADRIRLGPIGAVAGDGMDGPAVLGPAPDARPDASGRAASVPGDGVVPSARRPRRAGYRERRGRLALAGAALGLACLAGLWIAGPWGSADASATNPPVADGRPLVAVLPMENLGPPDAAYFAAGMTEEIIGRLTALPSIGVLPHTHKGVPAGAAAARGVAPEAQYVLTGSVRWTGRGAGGGRVRVTTRLTQAADGRALWSETYERDMVDVFAVQVEIAGAVAERLGVQLASAERVAMEWQPTRDLEAYHAYLRGQYYIACRLDFWSRENWLHAVAHFERAVARDPTYVHAYLGLVRAHSVLVNYGHDVTPERRMQARAAMERAIALAPNAPEVWLARGEFYYFSEFDNARAADALRVAEARLPDDPRVLEVTAFLFRRTGRWDDALDRFRRILRLNPGDARAAFYLGETYHMMHRYSEAKRYIDLAVALAPDEQLGYSNQALLHRATGNLLAARAVLERMPPDLQTHPYVQHTWLLQELAEGRYGAALDRLRRIEAGSPLPPRGQLLRAQLHSLAGDPGRARQAYAAALAAIDAEIPAQPRDGYRYPMLLALRGIALAGVGRHAEAVRDGEAAVAARPLHVDRHRTPARLEDLAQIYVMVGEPDAALDVIETLLSSPSWVSAPLLAVDPRWAPLREHPRYQATVGLGLR